MFALLQTIRFFLNFFFINVIVVFSIDELRCFNAKNLYEKLALSDNQIAEWQKLINSRRNSLLLLYALQKCFYFLRVFKREKEIKVKNY